MAGFRPELWASVAPDAAPPGAHGFNEPVVGAGRHAVPATQHDIVVWLTGAAYDVVFDLSRGVVAALAAHATLAHEIVGWPYHHDLDLTGFIDGTENPTLVEATAVALIPDGEPGDGGSILLLQQWEHDVVAGRRCRSTAQEAVIGRRKIDSVELDPRARGLARGPDRPGRLRQDLPAEHRLRAADPHGTIFVGLQRDAGRPRRMLDSMVGRPGGLVDDLTRFTRR